MRNLLLLILMMFVTSTLNAALIQGSQDNLSNFVLPLIECPSEDADACYTRASEELISSCKNTEVNFANESYSCETYNVYKTLKFNRLGTQNVSAYYEASSLKNPDKTLSKRSTKTNIHLAGSYTDYVFIRVHGAWRTGILKDSSIFKVISQSNKSINVIEMVLPGHGKDQDSVGTITYLDFIHSVERAVLLAQQLGKEIIFESHSMGGLLVAAANSIYSDIIAGSFLAAPAFGLSVYTETATDLPDSINGDIIGLDGLHPNLGRQALNLIASVNSIYAEIEEHTNPWIIYSTPQDMVVSHFEAQVFAHLLKSKGADVYFKSVHIGGGPFNFTAHNDSKVKFGDEAMYKAGEVERNYAEELLARLFNFCLTTKEVGNSLMLGTSIETQTCEYGEPL